MVSSLTNGLLIHWYIIDILSIIGSNRYITNRFNNGLFQKKSNIGGGRQDFSNKKSPPRKSSQFFKVLRKSCSIFYINPWKFHRICPNFQTKKYQKFQIFPPKNWFCVGNPGISIAFVLEIQEFQKNFYLGNSAVVHPPITDFN